MARQPIQKPTTKELYTAAVISSLPLPMLDPSEDPAVQRKNGIEIKRVKFTVEKYTETLLKDEK